jgi:hypothetical protein
MSTSISFTLRNESLDNLVFGTVTFNGKFVFELDKNIKPEIWERIGFIPVGEANRAESDDLFQYLNSRLPIDLRSKSSEQKLDYIKEQGLKVASDSFYLQAV